MPGPVRDFSVTLSDGLRVVGYDRGGQWSVHVYQPDGRLLGHAAAGTRLHALAQAGLSGDEAGEVLGRAGI
ncbi:MAG: hypothetical protein ABSG43_17435 [Solirubrobacteraceae bacterium]